MRNTRVHWARPPTGAALFRPARGRFTEWISFWKRSSRLGCSALLLCGSLLIGIGGLVWAFREPTLLSITFARGRLTQIQFFLTLLAFCRCCLARGFRPRWRRLFLWRIRRVGALERLANTFATRLGAVLAALDLSGRPLGRLGSHRLRRAGRVGVDRHLVGWCRRGWGRGSGCSRTDRSIGPFATSFLLSPAA